MSRIAEVVRSVEYGLDFRKRTAACGLAAAGLTGGHLWVEAAGSEYQGVLLPLDGLFDLASAIALVVLAWAIGKTILERVGFSPSSAVERLLVSTALGMGVEGTALLAIGTVSLLNPWALIVFGVFLVWGGRESLGELREEAGRIGAELQGGLGWWGGVALGAFAAFLLLQSGMPPTDWDVLTYHLDVPREFLDRAEVFLPEDNHHVAFVGLVHMLYVPLLALGAESAPAFISAIIVVLLAITIFRIGERLFDGDTGRIASVLMWGSPAILLVAVTARVDVSVTWFLVMAHYAVVVCFERREVTGWWWLGAVFIGLAIATKFSALGYLVGLAPVMAWVLIRQGDPIVGSVRRFVVFGAVAGLVASPWLVKNALLLGSPIYPYLAEMRLEPWLADYLGTLVVPESVDPDTFQIPAFTREPFSVTALFTQPGTMTPEREGAFYFGNFALLFLPLAVLAPWRKTVALLMPPILYCIIILNADSWINLRYLIPSLVIGTLVASEIISRVGKRMFSKESLRRTFFAGVLAVCLVPAAGAMYQTVSEMRPHEHWLGLRSEDKYLKDNGNPDVFLHARVESWINEMMSDSTRIAMLYESRGFRLQPDVLQDNLSRNWPILAESLPWHDCLAPTGASHVLVNYGHLGSLVRRGLDIQTVSWTAFSRFQRECLERQGVLGSVVLYRIQH